MRSHRARLPIPLVLAAALFVFPLQAWCGEGAGGFVLVEDPRADAGLDQTVTEGVTVTLDGLASTASAGIARYTWTQTDGSPVTLSNPGNATPTFVTPPVPAGGDILEFQLDVEDNQGNTHIDTVLVTVQDNGLGDGAGGRLNVLTATGDTVALTVATGGSLVALSTSDPANFSDTTNRPGFFRYGFFNFTIKTNVAGGVATMDFVLPDKAPSSYGWYKYTAARGFESYSGNVFWNADRGMVTVVLVDGGAGDEDGVKNSFITDPSGLAAPPANPAAGLDPLPETSSGGMCFVDAVREPGE
jgi:hypothetical protein